MPKSRGFTLVELLIVTAIIGVLSVAGLTAYSGVQKKARDTKRKADIEAIAKVMETKYDIKTATYNISANFSNLASDFADNRLPPPPRDNDYVISTDNKAYVACAKLENAPNTLSVGDCLRNINTNNPNNQFCFCRQSVTGSIVQISSAVNNFGRYTDLTGQFQIATVNLTGAASGYSFPRAFKYVFLTDGNYPGNLGGISGADIKCNNEADQARLPGGSTYKAWISKVNQIHLDRFNKYNIPYKLTDGTIIANNWDDLTDCSLQNPINRNAAGELLTNNSRVWSNTNCHGVNVSASCRQWTSSDTSDSSTFGISTTDTAYYSVGVESGYWALSNWGYPECNNTYKLYCFEQ